MSEDNVPLPEDHVLDTNPAENIKESKEKANSHEIYDRITKSDFLKQNSSIHRASPKMDSIAAQLDEILTPSTKTAPDLARDMIRGRRSDYRLLRTITQASSFSNRLLSPKLANTIRTSATLELLQFQKTVARNYMRKNLSLAYRQAVTLGNIAGTLTQMGQVLENKLDAIKVNTGRVATVTDPEPTMLDTLIQGVKDRATAVGKRQLTRGLTTFSKTKSLNATYQDFLSDVGNRVGAASRSYNSLRGRDSREQNFFSPIQRGLRALAEKRPNDNGHVAGIVGAAVPLLQNFKPELFRRDYSDNYYAYAKERKTPTYRLLSNWKTEQLGLLHQILDRIGSDNGGGGGRPGSGGGRGPFPGGSPRRTSPFRGGPNPISQGGALPETDEEDRRADRSGQTGLGRSRARMDPVSADRFRRTRAAASAYVSSRAAAFTDRVIDRLGVNEDGTRANRWFRQAQAAGIMSRNEGNAFRAYANEHGYAQAMRHYSDMANTRAQGVLQRLEPSARVSAQKLSEIRAYARQHGAQAAMTRFRGLIQSMPSYTAPDGTATTPAGAVAGVASGLYQSLRNRPSAGQSRYSDDLPDDGPSSGGPNRSRFSPRAALAAAMGALGARRSNVQRLEADPFSMPHGDELHPDHGGSGAGTHPDDGPGFLSRLLTGPLGTIAGTVAAPLGVLGAGKLYQRWRARGGGMARDLAGNPVETRAGRVMRRFFTPSDMRRLRTAGTPAARSAALRRMLLKAGYRTTRWGLRLPGRVARAGVRAAVSTATDYRTLGAMRYAGRTMLGRTAVGRGLKFMTVKAPWEITKFWGKPLLKGIGHVVFPRSMFGSLAAGMLLNNAENNADAITSSLGIHNHVHGVQAGLSGLEWAANANALLSLSKMTGRYRVPLSLAAGAIGMGTHLDPRFGTHVLEGAGLGGLTYGGLKLLGKSNTKWGRVLSAGAALLPFLTSHGAHAATLHDGTPTSPSNGGHPYGTGPVPQSTDGTDGPPQANLNNVDLREKYSLPGLAAEYGKTTLEDLLLVQGFLGLGGRLKTVIDSHAGKGTADRLPTLIKQGLFKRDPIAVGQLHQAFNKVSAGVSANPIGTGTAILRAPTRAGLSEAFSRRNLLEHAKTGMALAAPVMAGQFNRNILERYLPRLNADGTRNRTNETLENGINAGAYSLAFGSTGSMFGSKGRAAGQLLGAAYGGGLLQSPTSLLESGMVGLGSYALLGKLGIKSPALRRRLAGALGIGSALPGLAHRDAVAVDARTGEGENKNSRTDWGSSLGMAAAGVGLGHLWNNRKAIIATRSAMPLLTDGARLSKLAVGGVASLGSTAGSLINDKIVDRFTTSKSKDGKQSRANSIWRTIISMSGDALTGGELGSMVGPEGTILGAIGGAATGYFKEHPEQLRGIMGSVQKILHIQLGKAKKDLRTGNTHGAAPAAAVVGAGTGASMYRTYISGQNEQAKDDTDLTKDPSYKAAYALLNDDLKKRMDASKAMQYLLYSYAITNSPQHAADILNQRVTKSETDSDVVKDISAYRALKDQPSDPRDADGYLGNVFNQQATATTLLTAPTAISNYDQRISAGAIGVKAVGPPPPKDQLVLCKRAIDIFIGGGFTQIAAVAMAANDWYESAGMNKDAIGDKGQAYGLAQWHGTRRKLIELGFGKGKPMTKMSFDEQCQAQMWEIKNNPKGVCSGTYAGLMAATTLRDAVYVMVNNYEKPADRAGNVIVRTQRAIQLWKLFYNKDGSPKDDKAGDGKGNTDGKAPPSDPARVAQTPTGTGASGLPAAGVNVGGANLSAAGAVAATKDSVARVAEAQQTTADAKAQQASATIAKAVQRNAGGTSSAGGGTSSSDASSSGGGSSSGSTVQKIHPPARETPTKQPVAPTLVNAPTNHYHLAQSDQVSTRRRIKTS